MKITKRNTDLNLERISNGFVLTLTGRDDDNNYQTEKIFASDLKSATDLIQEYFSLPEDN